MSEIFLHPTGNLCYTFHVTTPNLNQIDKTALFGDAFVPPKSFKGVINRSFYLPARDGVRLAVDLFLPKDLPAGEHIPALLVQSRYWRNLDLRVPFGWFLQPEDLNRKMRGFKPFFVERGYALVYVDVRGTGASFGTWPYPWHPDAVQDGYDLVSWIVAQPWSNGRVGAFGVSYLAMTAEFLCSVGHPAVKAIVPQFCQTDPYADIATPGGMFNARFIRDWGRFGRELDQNRVPVEMGWLASRMVSGVKPVDEDREKRLLNEAIQAHSSNTEVYTTAFSMECRDQVHPVIQASIDDMAIHRCLEQVAQSGVAIFGWGSWMDAGTAEAVLRRFLTLENAPRAVIGAWEHGGQSSADPYLPPNHPVNPSLPAQWAEMMHFLDTYLKDANQGTDRERILHYYTLGEGLWKQTPIWPPAGIRPERWFLGENRLLLPSSPDSGASTDVYHVDFEATTGELNRWWELSGALRQTVVYRDRAAAGERMLCYFTPPLEQDIEITGNPVVNLYLSSTHPDGAVFVYLEDVDPSGQVTYITEGQLRLIHRAITDEPPPYRQLTPYHTFRQADTCPMSPGEISEITFGLLPVSALIRKDHRLRLGIAGHDQGTFQRIPAQGQPVLTIQRNSAFPSYIDLPIIRE